MGHEGLDLVKDRVQLAPDAFLVARQEVFRKQICDDDGILDGAARICLVR
jgi:hypothetical protein